MDSDNSIAFKPIVIKVMIAVSLLWAIKGLEILLGLDVGVYSVYPRTIEGLIGIAVGPMLHGSFEHLFSNTLALFVLATALFYQYPKSAKQVFTIIYIGSGIGVWLFARESHHLGASGLTHGMMFFLFLIGVLRRDKQAIALSMIVFFLYGSMVWGILPTLERISFESHLFGALMGVVCAVVFRHKDPKPPEKKYSWEEDDYEEELLDIEENTE
ncbi:MAG: rhomboid family intramembrane serine protease [Methylophagaceae bacterium]